MVELLVVVAILGVLVAIGIPSYQGYLAQTKLQSARNSLSMIHAAQQQYKADTGLYCTPAQCGSTAAIVSELFAGQQSIDEQSGYAFSVTAANAGLSFAAQASNGSVTCSINQTATITGC